MSSKIERKFEVPWGHVAAQQWGTGKSGQNWLLVHGWMDNSNTWVYLAPLLARRGDSVVAIDLPGNGLSSWLPPGRMYHELEHIATIQRIVLELGWTQFGLIGHSLGAAVCKVFAVAFPEEVNLLVMLDMANSLVRPLTNPVFELRIREAAESIIKLEHKIKDGYKKVFKTREEVIDRMLRPPVYMMDEGEPTYTRESAELLMERGLMKTEGGYCLRRDIRLLLPNLYKVNDQDFQDNCRKLECPHLLVEASKGIKLLSPTLPASSNFKGNQGFTLCEIEGLHHVHLNQPDKVNAIILDFIESNSKYKQSPSLTSHL